MLHDRCARMGAFDAGTRGPLFVIPVKVPRVKKGLLSFAREDAVWAIARVRERSERVG